MSRSFILAGAVFGFLAVAFGAFGAHALESRITAHSLEVFRTGVQYQGIHALVLLFVGGLTMKFPSVKLLRIAGWTFIAGILIFSGCLYALAMTGVKVLGAIVPLGGLSFLIGWACLAMWASREKF